MCYNFYSIVLEHRDSVQDMMVFLYKKTEYICLTSSKHIAIMFAAVIGQVIIE